MSVCSLRPYKVLKVRLQLHLPLRNHYISLYFQSGCRFKNCPEFSVSAERCRSVRIVHIVVIQHSDSVLHCMVDYILHLELILVVCMTLR